MLYSRWLYFLFLVTTIENAFTQPLFENTKYYSYVQVINPAVTGSNRYPLLFFSSKKYWINTPNSPYEISIGGYFRLGNNDFYKPNMLVNKTKFRSKERIGIGGFVFYDQNGPMGYFFSELEYAYHLPLNANGTTELSFGLSINISDYNINSTLLDPADMDDPLLTNSEKQAPVLDGGIGILFNTSQLFAGVSVKDILASRLFIDDSVNNNRDFFIHGGYKFFLHYFDVEPACVMSLTENITSFSGQLKIYYKDNNWLSLGYKSTNAFRFGIGFRVKKIQIAYALEQSYSTMADYFPNTHEIILGINIGHYEPVGLKKTVKRWP
jgi:type IX secretion system PorP/SprF family membrane protein